MYYTDVVEWEISNNVDVMLVFTGILRFCIRDTFRPPYSPVRGWRRQRNLKLTFSCSSFVFVTPVSQSMTSPSRCNDGERRRTVSRFVCAILRREWRIERERVRGEKEKKEERVEGRKKEKERAFPTWTLATTYVCAYRREKREGERVKERERETCVSYSCTRWVASGIITPCCCLARWTLSTRTSKIRSAGCIYSAMSEWPRWSWFARTVSLFSTGSSNVPRGFLRYSSFNSSFRNSCFTLRREVRLI